MKIKVNIEILPNGAGLPVPSYQTEYASGIDLYAAVEKDTVIKAGMFMLIPAGIKMEIPISHELQIRPRSGLSLHHGITVLNTPGTVDPDYRGEIGIILINHSQKDFIVERGMRIAQGVFAEISRAEIKVEKKLNDTKRGEGGFGHTGK